MVNFENTPENAREILKNLGQNIDIIAGIVYERLLQLRGCAALELKREPICCAVSVCHPLAQRQRLCIEDLYGQNLMLIRRNWSKYIDLLRDDLREHHPQVHIVDSDFFSAQVFNQCEHSDVLMMALSQWAHIHLLLNMIPADWSHMIPFGLLHATSPSPAIKEFLAAAAKVFGITAG